MKAVEVHRPAMIWLLAASVAVIVFGVATTGLWYPALSIWAAPGMSAGREVVLAYAVYSSAGPLSVLLGLIVGWVRIVAGRRFSGLKWMIVIPLIWLVGLLGWLLVIGTLCDGEFGCGV